MKAVLQGCSTAVWTEYSRDIKHIPERLPSTTGVFLLQWKSKADEVLLGKLKMALGF